MAKINIYNEPLETPKLKKVLLFSGGLDSWIAMRLWKPDLLLYIAINHRAQEKEQESIQRLQPLPIPFSIDTRLCLRTEERLDAIIPLRNLYFAMIASRYGDTIGMGVLHGEVNGDKSHSFRKQAGAIMSLCYSSSYWSKGRNIQVIYPICQWTKAEAIHEYLRKGFSKKELLLTRSCYATTSIHCGVCSNCVKRYIAFVLNGIKEPYARHPSKSPFVMEFKKRFSSYDPKRRREIIKVFG